MHIHTSIYSKTERHSSQLFYLYTLLANYRVKEMEKYIAKGSNKHTCTHTHKQIHTNSFKLTAVYRAVGLFSITQLPLLAHYRDALLVVIT